jgi:MarR family transcriptional regulator, organic hydroperoxide resistance regulator
MTKKSAGKTTGPLSVTEQAKQIDRSLTAIRQILQRPLASAFAEGELTGAQQAVMRVLVESPRAMTLGEVRQSLGLAQSTVSGIVERLVKRGLIARERDPVDGRATLLAPSKPVREFLEKTMPELTRSPLAGALRLAREPERKAIADALRRLHELLEEASSSGNA